jgi:hypothetical protein
MTQLNIEPGKVVFEGSVFVIYDISDLLPKHHNFPNGTDVLDPTTNQRAVRSTYAAIPNRQINKVIYHQTAGGYQPAFNQVVATGQFFVRDPKWKWNDTKQKWLWTGEGRGWPGFAYTYFAPFKPLVHNDKLVVFQCNPLPLVTWHTGDGCNHDGVGLAFQGYFLEPSAGVNQPLKGTDGQPSDEQLQIADAFWLEYAQPILKASLLTGHYKHGKPSCPGQTLRERIEKLGGGND